MLVTFTLSTLHGSRLFCSYQMEYDIHTVLDLLTLLATAAVIYCMAGHSEIRRTYQREQDGVKFYYVVRSTSGCPGC